MFLEFSLSQELKNDSAIQDSTQLYSYLDVALPNSIKSVGGCGVVPEDLQKLRGACWLLKLYLW